MNILSWHAHVCITHFPVCDSGDLYEPKSDVLFRLWLLDALFSLRFPNIEFLGK